MDIERFIFQPDGDVPPTTLGINIRKRYGLTHVNLFSLSENEGQPVSKNIWEIAQQILRDILMGQKIDDLQWTLTAGHRTSSLNFSTFNNKPYKLDIADEHTLKFEQHDLGRLSIDRYSKDYDGQPPIDVSRGRVRERVMDPSPKTVFSIPCENGGMFYCEPSFYSADHMRDGFEYILVDTKKIIAQLKKDDPRMLDHAQRKISGSTPEQWLDNSSIDYPYNMGNWTFDKKNGLTLCSGDAALIKVAEGLNLPYFPIAVDKRIGKENIDALKSAVGYGRLPNGAQPNMSPTYTYTG